jgi:hypothetical protein
MMSFLFPPVTLGHLLDSTAVIKAIPSGTDPTARTTVISSLVCTTPQALDAEEKERAGMASTTKGFRSMTAVPGSAVTGQHRFVTGGVDYRIRGITKVPADSPQFYEFLLEDEGVVG